MKKWLFLTGKVALIFGLFLLHTNTNAHPLLPPEAMEYIQQNPDASNEDIETFFQTQYGTDMEQYFRENPDPNDLPIPDEEALKDQEGILKNYDEETRAKVRLIYSLKRGEISFSNNAKNFIILGVKHILEGIDHVLFVISLVLILAPWRRIFAMVSTFTIAHSLTLLLAGTETLTLSSKIVEPIIAFSIAYVAFTSVFLKNYKFFHTFNNKLIVVFLFGLFHGLGFAGVFEEIQVPSDKYLSSLLFFNGGVEVGQIIILAVAVPFLLCSAKSIHHKYFIRIISGIIIGISLYWMVDRILS